MANKRKSAPVFKDYNNTQRMAIAARKPAPGLIMHTDRGRVYASRKFQKLLEQNGMLSSVSKKGDPWDNAVAESFFKSLKSELVDWQYYKNRDQARRDIFEYIEIFYNRVRLHSVLGYLSPVQFAAKATQKAA